MGIKTNHLKDIKDISKNRKDGVYTKHGWAFVVKDRTPTILLGFGGELMQIHGEFTIGLGSTGTEYGATVSELRKIAKDNKWI